MQYRLERISPKGNTIGITEREFAAISRAKRGLVVVTGFEEKFYLLLENYAEFEQALLEPFAGWFSQTPTGQASRMIF